MNFTSYFKYAPDLVLAQMYNILNYPKFVGLSNQRQLLRWEMKRMCEFLPLHKFLLFSPISESKLEFKTARNLFKSFCLQTCVL